MKKTPFLLLPLLLLIGSGCKIKKLERENRKLKAKLKTLSKEYEKLKAREGEWKRDPHRFFAKGKWIDLSHDFSSETIYWPTAGSFQLKEDFKGITQKGYYYSAYRFSAAEHGGSDYDYRSHTISLWLGKTLPYDMNITIGINYIYRDFNQPNFRAGGPFTRQESFWGYSLYWSKKWNKGISSFISYSFLDSKSNLGVYRYQKNRVMFGMRWDG